MAQREKSLSTAAIEKLEKQPLVFKFIRESIRADEVAGVGGARKSAKQFCQGYRDSWCLASGNQTGSHYVKAGIQLHSVRQEIHPEVIAKSVGRVLISLYYPDYKRVIKTARGVCFAWNWTSIIQSIRVNKLKGRTMALHYEGCFVIGSDGLQTDRLESDHQIKWHNRLK